MADFKSNEREFSSQVISWLNEFIKIGSYPFEVASAETSLKISGKTKFPDVQIWLNRKANQGFCGWELKTPATQVDDQVLLNNAAEKARAMHADYFVTWNMRDAVIWRTPHIYEVVSNAHRLKTYPPTHQISSPDDLWVSFKQELLKSRAKEILNDLAILNKEGHLHLIDVDSTFFVHVLSEAVKTLQPHMYEALIGEIGKNSKFKDELFSWAVKQGIATNEAGEAFFEAISRQVVYRLLGKILFYLTLRRFRSDIPKLSLHGINPNKVSEKLNEYFAVARQIDYQSVFEKDFTDSVPFPVKGIETLIKLLDDLNRYNFSYMPQDVVGNVFEKLIPSEERHSLGQYFTNENLVDFITAFCVRTRADKVLDPTCGTGTFLIRAYNRLKNAGEKDHKKLLSQIWGIDTAHFPAELATINLYKQNIEDYANFPRIVPKDFFEVKMGDTFKFPPPKLPTGSDFMVDETIPQFDAIVGNFPYIRQELIEKRIKGYKNKLSEVLGIDWKHGYPDLFQKSGQLKLSGQADIYAYLFFHASSHLKEGGRMGIVTSNSWLDVAYGYELQKFFLNKFKVIAIIESRCEPWFEDAAVNTIVTVLERCEDKERRDESNVKFVKIKKKLRELIPWDMNIPMDRWTGLDKLIYLTENIGTEYLEPKGEKFVNTLRGHATFEDENFRIRVLRQAELLDELETTGKTVKWGKYLRAPEVYFEIMAKCRESLVPLNKVAEIKRGYTTGINEFFYVDGEKIKHWKIDEEFLFPLLKSPKEFKGILIESKSLKTKIFYCNKSRDELRKTKKTGALKYIEWGETQKTKPGQKEEGGVFFPEIQSVKQRKVWYSLPAKTYPKLVWIKGYDKTFRVAFSRENIFVDQQLYSIYPKNINEELLAAILNSTFFYLNIELCGRIPFGEGVLWTTVEEAQDYAFLPDPKKIPISIQKKLLNNFDSLIKRPIKPIFDEVKMKDRQELDSLVLEALGLDPKEYLKPLYEGLTELVSERINLAKSRKKVKQAKAKKDIEKLKKQVIEEIVPDGAKIFPEEFIDSKYLKDSKEISVPDGELKLGFHFFGKQEVVTDDGFKYEAETSDEANYIIYAQKPNSFLIKIPLNEASLIKAVNNYERYLKNLKAKLFEMFFTRTLDHKQADTLANEVFSSLGLPDV